VNNDMKDEDPGSEGQWLFQRTLFQNRTRNILRKVIHLFVKVDGEGNILDVRCYISLCTSFQLKQVH
jgi:hypothetical protein